MIAGAEQSRLIKMQCYFTGCERSGIFQCSQCKVARYCCKEHQKQDWKCHKLKCVNVGSVSSKPKSFYEAVQPAPNDLRTPATQADFASDDLSGEEHRHCRCMFCGEELKLSSEEAAVDHMRVCVALQEQLQSKDQFTIPSVVRNKCASNL